jgi:hypothetical protein
MAPTVSSRPIGARPGNIRGMVSADFDSRSAGWGTSNHGPTSADTLVVGGTTASADLRGPHSSDTFLRGRSADSSGVPRTRLVSGPLSSEVGGAALPGRAAAHLASLRGASKLNVQSGQISATDKAAQAGGGGGSKTRPSRSMDVAMLRAKNEPGEFRPMSMRGDKPRASETSSSRTSALLRLPRHSEYAPRRSEACTSGQQGSSMHALFDSINDASDTEASGASRGRKWTGGGLAGLMRKGTAIVDDDDEVTPRPPSMDARAAAAPASAPAAGSAAATAQHVSAVGSPDVATLDSSYAAASVVAAAPATTSTSTMSEGAAAGTVVGKREKKMKKGERKKLSSKANNVFEKSLVAYGLDTTAAVRFCCYEPIQCYPMYCNDPPPYLCFLPFQFTRLPSRGSDTTNGGWACVEARSIAQEMATSTALLTICRQMVIVSLSQACIGMMTTVHCATSVQSLGFHFTGSGTFGSR